MQVCVSVRSSVDVNQVWYADDAAATGTVLNLKEWWDNINNFGPQRNPGLL